jgi:serine/threonine protein kinase
VSVPDYVGKHTGNFSIVRKLGDGGFATVYLGQHSVLEKRVAVKFLLEEWVNEPDVVARFFDEARTMERLKAHPNIVGIVDIASKEICDKEGVPPYFIMDFVEGKSLDAMIKGDEGFTLDYIVEICKAALSALEYCHKKGVIHRDIKPSNILIDIEKHVWLTDFGIAKARLNTSKTGTGLTLGSCDYMSPEQALGKRDLDHRSDIYSFGVTMYEMVVGKLPFINENPNAVALMHIQEEAKSPREHNDAVPERLNYIIMKAMEKKPENRFQSCQEMIDALEKVNEPEPEIKEDVPTVDLMKMGDGETPEESIRTDSESTTRQRNAVAESTMRKTLTSPAVKNTVRLVTLILAFTAVFLGLMKGYQYYTVCTVTFKSTPPGAKIIFGGTMVATDTNPRVLVVPPGTYKTVFSLDGYATAAAQVTVGPPREITISRHLSKDQPELVQELSELRKAVSSFPVPGPKKNDKLLAAIAAAWGKLEDKLDEHLWDEKIHLDYLSFCKDRGELKRAEEFYQKRKDQDKQNVIPLVMLARIQLQKNTKKDDEEAYDKLLGAKEIDPNSVLWLNTFREWYLKDAAKKTKDSKEWKESRDQALGYCQMSLYLKDDPEIKKIEEELLKGL